MRTMITKAIACAALAGALFSAVTEASAMPVAGLAPTVTTDAAVQDVRLVCGPFRCFRTFGYGYGYRRPFYRGYRFGHPFRHHWGYRRFY